MYSAFTYASKHYERRRGRDKLNVCVGVGIIFVLLMHFCVYINCIYST